MRQAVRLTLRALVVFAVLALAGAAASAIDGVVEDVWGSCSLSFTSLSQTRATASATSHTGGITADVLEVEIDLAENNVFQLNAEVSMEDVWFVQVVRGEQPSGPDALRSLCLPPGSGHMV